MGLAIKAIKNKREEIARRPVVCLAADKGHSSCAVACGIVGTLKQIASE